MYLASSPTPEMNLQGLLYIEYGFHVTLMIAAIILAYCVLRLLSRWGVGSPSVASGSSESSLAGRVR